MMKLGLKNFSVPNISVNPVYVSNSLKFLFIFLILSLIFFGLALMKSISNVIETVYVLDKPSIVDALIVSGINDFYSILPFVIVFSLCILSLRLTNLGKPSSVIIQSIVIGVIIYIIFFVFTLVNPLMTSAYVKAQKNFSQSKVKVSPIFESGKVHVVDGKSFIVISGGKSSLDIGLIDNGRLRIFRDVRIVKGEDTVLLKKFSDVVLGIPYSVMFPEGFGKMYTKIYNLAVYLASFFDYQEYFSNTRFFGFVNMMFYSIAISLSIVFLGWIFRKDSFIQVVLLSFFISLIGIIVLGFLGSIFEFMQLSSRLDWIKDIVSGVMAILLSSLIVLVAYKMDNLLRRVSV